MASVNWSPSDISGLDQWFRTGDVVMWDGVSEVVDGSSFVQRWELNIVSDVLYLGSETFPLPRRSRILDVSRTVMGNFVTWNATVMYQDGSRQHYLATEHRMGSSTAVNPMSHYSQVRYFRESFKDYSTEDFRKLSKEPLVKDILQGLAVVPKEEVKKRINMWLKKR